MKSAVWAFAALAVSSAVAFPAEQVVLGGGGALGSAESYATQFLSDAKKAILSGKKNLDKWAHDGKEFIKQDGMLCAYLSSPCRLHPNRHHGRAYLAPCLWRASASGH